MRSATIGRTGHGVDDLAAGRVARQIDEVGDDRAVELVEGVRATRRGRRNSRRRRRPSAAGWTRVRSRTTGASRQQVERPARDEFGVTGAESDDSDDGLHL